jgi:hypothetical protein
MFGFDVLVAAKVIRCRHSFATVKLAEEYMWLDREDPMSKRGRI